MNFKLGLCQLKSGKDKNKTLLKAENIIREAADMGADIISLPEMFNCPYETGLFREYAETKEGTTVKKLSNIAAELGVYIIGGSIPEICEDKIYNACFCFDRKGEVIAVHRKAHLFDIDVKGGIRFMESETLSAGEKTTVFDTEYCKIGVGICYDVRFPEMFRKMTLEGAKLVVLPAAFNMTTGPAHWDLTMRARALDNQIYFAACAPARDVEGSYVAYAHSCVANPWGDFAGKLDENPGVLICEIDLEYLERIRNQLPLLKQRRPEIY